MDRMMGLMIALSAVQAVQTVFGSVADTNLAVRTMGEYIMLVDAAEEDETRQADGVSTNAGVLTEAKVFGLPTVAGWTATENRQAVDAFFSSQMFMDDYEDACAARALLGFLADAGNTNAFGYAKSILVSTNNTCRAVAWPVYLQYVHPAISENAFIEMALRNEQSMLGPGAKGNVYLKYGAKLMSLDLASDWCTATNGACILYRGLTNRVGAIQTDRIMAGLFPLYANSSNRLALAMMAMADDERSSSNCHVVTSRFGVVCIEGAELKDGNSPLVRYFAPITNRLMSIQGPLPEVEELR